MNKLITNKLWGMAYNFAGAGQFCIFAGNTGTCKPLKNPDTLLASVALALVKTPMQLQLVLSALRAASGK